jgi:hypothetical protein
MWCGDEKEKELWSFEIRVFIWIAITWRPWASYRTSVSTVKWMIHTSYGCSDDYMRWLFKNIWYHIRCNVLNKWLLLVILLNDRVVIDQDRDFSRRCRRWKESKEWTWDIGRIDPWSRKALSRRGPYLSALISHSSTESPKLSECSTYFSVQSSQERRTDWSPSALMTASLKYASW